MIYEGFEKKGSLKQITCQIPEIVEISMDGVMNYVNFCLHSI